ncbi:MAG: low molecular weight phosphatase family protein [Acidobacteriota bacterium]|nr:low molecular weight phosphatase family protein [Acidobacteriota bacterium]
MATEKSAAKTAKSARRRVIFICVGNSCRSQFAEAFARKHAPDVIDASSAGIAPFGRIVEPTVSVGSEFGLTFDGQSSKGFGPEDLAAADLIVNLTGIDSPGLFKTARPVVVWDVDDPFGEDLDVYRRIAAQIEAKILLLAAEFRAANVGSR